MALKQNMESVQLIRRADAWEDSPQRRRAWTSGEVANEAQKSINCLSARHELGLRCDDQNREMGGLTPSFYFN
jgi:hypothetical protein